MDGQRSSTLQSILFILLLLAIAGFGWASQQYLTRYMQGGDFAVQYAGIRALALSDTSPYDNSVRTAIANTADRFQPAGKYFFAVYNTPIFAGLVSAPFALTNEMDLARTLWFEAQVVAIFLTMYLGLRITGWRPKWYIFLLLGILTFLSAHMLVPLLYGSLGIWTSLFAILALAALRTGRQELTGILLAFSFIQPQSTVLLIVLVLAWSLYQRKKLVALWFGAALLVMMVIGLLFTPDWVLRYLQTLYRFTTSIQGTSPREIFQTRWPGLGNEAGWGVTILASLMLLFEWFLALKKDFRWLFWTACLTLVLNQWIGMRVLPGDGSTLLMATVLVLAVLEDRWGRGGRWTGIGMLAMIFAWEWFIMIRAGGGITANDGLLLPLPLMCLIGLYWMRWWAVRPKRTLIEELRSSEAI